MKFLPLFQKELLEQANRKKTYIVRILFGLAVFGAFLFNWHKNLGNQSDIQSLGQGKYLIKDN